MSIDVARSDKQTAGFHQFNSRKVSKMCGRRAVRSVRARNIKPERTQEGLKTFNGIVLQ